MARYVIVHKGRKKSTDRVILGLALTVVCILGALYAKNTVVNLSSLGLPTCSIPGHIENERLKRAVRAEQETLGRGVICSDGGILETKEKNVVTLLTSHGRIYIRLRPDLSPDSMRYVQKIFISYQPCSPFNFYRAAKPTYSKVK